MNISSSTAQWLNTIYYIATAALAIPMGKVAQNRGLITCGIIYHSVVAALSLGSFFINNFFGLLVIRFISGIAVGGQIAVKNTIVAKYPKSDKIQKFISLTMIQNQVVSIIAPFAAGWLLKFDFHWNFLVTFALSLVSAILLIFFNQPEISKEKSRFDIFGSLLLMLLVSGFCLCFTLISLSEYIFAGISVGISVISLIGFFFAEKRHQDPVLPLYLMKNPVSDIFIQNVLNFAMATAVNWLIPQIINNSQKSGLIGSMAAVISLGTAIILPFINQKIIGKYIIMTSFSALIIMFTLGAVLSQSQVAFIVISLISTSFVSSIVQQLYPMTLLSVSQKMAGKVAAFPTTSRTIGNSISLCVMSTVTTLVFEKNKQNGEPEALKRGAQADFIILLLLSTVGLLDAGFRIGCFRNEKGKCGYNESKIRELKQESELLNVMKEVRTEETQKMTELEATEAGDNLENSNLE